MTGGGNGAESVAAGADVSPSTATLGARLQRVRLRKGVSVRDLAEAAGVNKNTILRLEKGLTPSYATLTRVCDALGVHVAQLTRPEPDEEETIALHQRQEEVRQTLRGGDASGDRDPVVLYQEAAGALPFAADEKVLLTVLAARLPGGRLNAAVLELYGESETVTHPGEEMVFCLRGSARLTVAGRTYRLREGDAATFWCSERHSYGVWEDSPDDGATGAEALPVKLLSIWIDTRDEGHGA